MESWNSKLLQNMDQKYEGIGYLWFQLLALNFITLKRTFDASSETFFEFRINRDLPFLIWALKKLT